MESKMRIKLYSENGEYLLSDRLVEQKTEFAMGPKLNHVGPLSIEVNLRSAEDVDSLVEYLKKLKGDLPITVKETPKGKQKGLEQMLKEKEPLKELLNNALEKGTTQEALINFLRGYNFVFITSDILRDITNTNPELFSLKDEKHDKYQFLVRLIKQAKDPANDKYDFRLVFGIKIVGTKVDRVLIYLWGKFKTRKEIKWEKKNKINFKKVEKLLMFPEFMDYAERKRWRHEHRKLEANPQLEPSKFYTKYKPHIKVH